MDVYTHEKEQIEGIKTWWQENRWYIIGGLVISVIAVGGWRMWLQHQLEQAEAASQKYENVITHASTGDKDALQAAVSELQNDYAGTPYASLATLKLAAAQVEADEYAAAAESLRWVLDHADDDELALVARLRLARVHFQLNELADVHRVLDVSSAGEFEALFEEVRGDAFLAAGDRENARAAYDAAIAAAGAGGDTRRVQMKLDNLAMPLDALFGTSESPAADEAAGDSGESGE